MKRRTVLIAGASRGLGYYLAQKYLEDGAQVLAGVRNPETGQMRELAEKYPDTLILLPMDVSDTSSVEKAAALAAERVDQIHVVINNAGIHADSSFEPLERADLDDCIPVYNVNAVGPLRVAKAFLSLIPEHAGGLIVNISSESGSISTAGRKKEFDYCMSKAALNMGTKLLDNYLCDRGIKVIAVHPGWMRTDMGGQNAHLDPYETACKLAELFGRVDGKDRELTFMDNDGKAYPW